MKKTGEQIIFDIMALTVTTIFAVLCLLPILYTLSGSFTDELTLAQGLKLIPEKFSLDAYKMVLANPASMLRAYGITIALVVFGTAISLWLTTMTAYVLYRKDYKWRNKLSFFLFFTTLFSGGLVPHYILNCALGLRNTFMVMLVSGLVNVFNIIVIRSFFTSSVPQSLVESTKIDGANDFTIYAKIVMPTSLPILATVGLLIALAYWNNWSTAAIYVTNSKLYPLQYYLYQIFQGAEMSQALAESGLVTEVKPAESYKLAMTIFTMGPVVLFYPFVQKYFVAGVTIGAIKE